MSQHNSNACNFSPNFGSGTGSKYQLKMDRQYPSGVSDYSPSTSFEGRQNSPRAGKSNRAALGSNLDGGQGKERHGEQEDGSGVSDYSPRPHHPAANGYLDSGEEGSHSPASPRYSPTSPRYSRPASRLAVSDYSSGEEHYNGTSDVSLRKAKRSEKRQRSLEIDTTESSEDMQLANEKTRKTLASPKASSSHSGEAGGAQSDVGALGGFALWVRGGHPATKKQKRKRASEELVQFLITQNQSLSRRLEKVEIALALVQSQTGPHEKPETCVTGDKFARNQHESVATGDSETVKTGCALQRECLRLAWDICIIACLVVGIAVLLKLPKVLDAMVGLMDQKTKNLRFEHSANCDAGR
jgi:hypothetical protein